MFDSSVSVMIHGAALEVVTTSPKILTNLIKE